MSRKAGADRRDADRSEWDARPGWARTIRALTILVPLAAGMAASIGVSRILPPTSSTLGAVVRTLAVIAATSAVVWGVDRFARRFLPLAALLQLSLIFPDQAPSRFRAALRSGSSRRLGQLVAETRSSGLPADAGDAARRVVELIGAIGDHDRRTRGHSERVRLYADLIGEELRLGREERQKLQWGALLHDLGKLMVPAEILNKAGRPDEEEWAILSQHPLHGERLIEPLRGFLGEWAEAVGGHHERWDGKGYPRGLRSEEVPRSAAIVAVADSFEVMTAVRSYKTAMSLRDARAELTRCAGTQFEPEVVRAFLSVSLGRLRMAMGPLAAFAHVPFLEGIVRVPAGISGSGGAVVSAVGNAGPAVASSVAATALVFSGVGPVELRSGLPASPVAAAAAPSAPAPPAADGRPATTGVVATTEPLAAPVPETSTTVPVVAGGPAMAAAESEEAATEAPATTSTTTSTTTTTTTTTTIPPTTPYV